MRILGLGSATKVISIGLIDDEKVLVETTISDIHAEKIMFYVKEAGIKPKEIEGVAVSIGPGSYSGLRGGLATAKSLAQTLKVPLVGVSTLEAIAYNLIDIEGTMAVILDARLDEYNFALFGAFQGRLKRLTDDLVIKVERLKDFLDKITGEIKIVRNAHPYGINIARLGLQRTKTGEKDDPLKLTPKYSHKPNVREFKK